MKCKKSVSRIEIRLFIFIIVVVFVTVTIDDVAFMIE